VNCISYFFTGDKPYFKVLRTFVKQYKIGSVPGFRSVIVNAVKLFTGLNTSKMFYLSDGIIPPVSFCPSLFLLR